MSATTPGRRERKKEETRQALHRAAVRLAGEHGLEHLTVEMIADAVDVSRRTFSNYFANKEEALLWSAEAWLSRLIELVTERPPAEPAWAALSAAAEQLCAEQDTDPQWAAQVRLLRSHPSLLVRQVATLGVAERSLSGLVAQRLPGGTDDVPRAEVVLRAQVMATTFLGITRLATQTWLAHPDRTHVAVLRELLAMALEPWA